MKINETAQTTIQAQRDQFFIFKSATLRVTAIRRFAADTATNRGGTTRGVGSTMRQINEAQSKLVAQGDRDATPA